MYACADVHICIILQNTTVEYYTSDGVDTAVHSVDHIVCMDCDANDNTIFSLYTLVGDELVSYDKVTSLSISS